MSGRSTRVPIVILIAFSFVVGLAGPAWAPRSWGLPNLFADCHTPSGSARFNGALGVADFLVTKDGILVAQGSITGSCPTPDPRAISDAQYQAPVTILSASCDEVVLQLGTVTLRDLTIELGDAPVHIIYTEPPRDVRFRVALCAISLLNRVRKPPPRVMAALLDLTLLEPGERPRL